MFDAFVGVSLFTIFHPCFGNLWEHQQFRRIYFVVVGAPYSLIE